VTAAAELDRLAQRLDPTHPHRLVQTPPPEQELSLLHHFAGLTDPRLKRTRRHELTDVLVIALCAVLGGADSWNEIQAFGEAKKAWFERFLALPNGIPSHDTFNRVFAALDPEAFRACFTSWMSAVCARLGLKHVQIDGKALRGSRGRKGTLGCLHTVSVWAAEAGLTLGQVAVDDKSNEITAIPKLLELLDLSGALVSIDAMGCQKEIARQIVEAGGDYLLAVKENQPTLYEEIRACFTEALDSEFAGLRHGVYVSREEGHGRQEERIYSVIYDPPGLLSKGDWPGLKAIILVSRERREGGKVSHEASYYISSSTAGVKRLAAGIRGHWGIENKVHWLLDVTFREDDSRARAGHAAENLAWLRRVSLALLRQDDGPGSIKVKRKTAGWDTDFLERLLARLDHHLLPEK
jgi:predicted transposase YbfD/YdcC